MYIRVPACVAHVYLDGAYGGLGNCKREGLR